MSNFDKLKIVARTFGLRITDTGVLIHGKFGLVPPKIVALLQTGDMTRAKAARDSVLEEDSPYSHRREDWLDWMGKMGVLR